MADGRHLLNLVQPEEAPFDPPTATIDTESYLKTLLQRLELQEYLVYYGGIRLYEST